MPYPPFPRCRLSEYCDSRCRGCDTDSCCYICNSMNKSSEGVAGVIPEGATEGEVGVIPEGVTEGIAE